MKTLSINKILVPIDFSKVSENALQTAIAMCKRQFASLTILYVVENSHYMFQPAAEAAFVLPQLIEAATENIAKLAKSLRTKHDLVVNHLVQSGNPADEICHTASSSGADLIVMGTHGVSGLREFFIGSNAYRVVKNASCPVMTIPGYNQWLDFKKILFPVRLIPHALDKYDFIRPVIRKNGASLLIAGLAQRNDPAGLNEMNALVDHLMSKIAEDDVICGSDVHYCENISKQVLDVANLEKPDLIVISATLDETIRDFFLGPYTQHIVNHSHFPVLSIRPELTPNAGGMLTQQILAEFDGLYQQNAIIT